jgi:hypothetical protein
MVVLETRIQPAAEMKQHELNDVVNHAAKQ